MPTDTERRKLVRPDATVAYWTSGPRRAPAIVQLHGATKDHQLWAPQVQALKRLRQQLRSGPQRIVDVFPALFHRAIGEQDGQQLSLATGEAVACMNYLIAERAVECTVDGNGVAWYALK